MCTNLKYVYNKYIHERVLTPCGNCSACLQQKADARAFKIRSSQSIGTICLFITLTYNNDSLPVIRRDSIRSFADIPVYRRNGGSFDIIDTITLKDLSDFTISDLRKLKSPNGYHNRDYVGIIYYKDVQRFFKRLRINLQRKFNYYGTFKYYASSEYGETDFRPHFHIALTIPEKYEDIFRAALNESWRMHDSYRLPRWIEKAFDVSSYTAAYVNSSANLPKIFSTGALRQKHSYSKMYGVSVSEFDVSSLLSKVQSGSLSYVSETIKGKKQSFNTFLFPKYVIGRYFPLFKGFTRITPRQARIVLYRPSYLRELIDDVTDEDIRKIEVSLKNHFHYVKSKLGNFVCSDGSLLGYSYGSYVNNYLDTWRCYYSTKYILFLQKQLLEGFPPEYYYDNLADVTRGLVHHDYFSNLQKTYLMQFHDPNSNTLRVKFTEELNDRFSKMTKRKKENYHFYRHLKYTR